MVPNTIRSARLHATGGPDVFSLDDVALPPLGAREVCIAVAVAGVTYPDLLIRAGKLPAPALPHTIGYEVAGTIEALGAGVTELAAGARVIAMLPRGGGYATHAIASIDDVVAIDPPIAFDAAVALAIGGRTALLMLRHARLSPDEAIVIPGATGGLGSIAVRLAAAMGATVIAGIGAETKRAAALARGAAHVVCLGAPGWADDVKRATGGRGADVVLQSGAGAGAESLRALAPLGRLVRFGADNFVAPEPLSAEQTVAMLGQGQSLGGFSVTRTPPDVRARAFAELCRRVSSGSLPLELARYPLADVARAHADLDARRVIGKVVLEPR